MVGPVIATDGGISAALRAFIDDLVPGARIEELGGWMSTNLRLRSDATDVVIRIHDASVSRARLRAQQQLRSELAARGLLVPTPMPVNGALIHSFDGSLVEIEPYIPHEVMLSVPANFPWLFEVMGSLHAEFRTVTLPVPRPAIGHWVSPATLRRWIERSITAAHGDPEALSAAIEARQLIRRIERGWPRLPNQLVHGDIKTENLARTSTGRTVHFDFGAAAYRPRIHDLAFTFIHSVTAHVDTQPLDAQLSEWSTTPGLVKHYEAASGQPLSDLEREALVPYTAAVRLFHPAVAHKYIDMADILIRQRPAIELTRWILDHPQTLTG